MMSRPSRAVRVDALQLEGRLLLAARPVPSVATATEKPVLVQLQQSVGFVGTPTPGTSQVTQVVYQQDGAATVTLSESGYEPMQVEVKTDPSSPAVGVNVGAVDQIVTFKNQTRVTLSVPILAGAPNPGEVDVTLTATPDQSADTHHREGPPGAPHPGVGSVETANHHLRPGHPQGHRAHVQQADGPGRGLQREKLYGAFVVRYQQCVRPAPRLFPVWVPASHIQEPGAAPGRRVRSRDELGDAHPQGKADLQEPDHRDPGVRVEQVVTARTPVGRPPRSHRPGRQSDQWGLDPRKILGYRHDRESAACHDRESTACTTG